MDGSQPTPAPDEPRAPARRAAGALRAAWAVLWRTLALVCVWGVLLGPLFAVVGPRLGKGASSTAAPIRLAVEAGTAAALLLATVVLVRWTDRRPLASAGLGGARLGRDAALGLAGAAAWLAACLAPVAAAGWVSIDVGGTFNWSALAIASAALGANAFTQELLFRGYPFQLVLGRAGPVAAAVVTSVLFSAAHLPVVHGAWLPAVNIALAGALFAVALLRTGTLWLAVGLHAGWNVLLGPVLGLDVSSRADLGAGWHVLALHGPDPGTGGPFGLEGSLATTIVTAAAIALLAGRRPLARAGGARVSGRGDPPRAAGA